MLLNKCIKISKQKSLRQIEEVHQGECIVDSLNFTKRSDVVTSSDLLGDIDTSWLIFCFMHS